MEVQDLANKIPASAEIEKRFSFIENDILRSNIAMAFQYVLNEALFKKSEKVRNERNKIHLAGLSKVEDYYCKKDVDNIFKIAKDIIERVELKINELKDV